MDGIISNYSMITIDSTDRMLAAGTHTSPSRHLPRALLESGRRRRRTYGGFIPCCLTFFKHFSRFSLLSSLLFLLLL